MGAGIAQTCALSGYETLLDSVGLDTTLWAAEAIYEEYKDPLYAPPPLLRRMVESGMNSRKSDKGFYIY
jgi:3-hydroxybutyryl-CoA dehydrogenase